jgi:hypothetical protein
LKFKNSKISYIKFGLRVERERETNRNKMREKERERESEIGEDRDKDRDVGRITLVKVQLPLRETGLAFVGGPDFQEELSFTVSGFKHIHFYVNVCDFL